jgi:PIN like domain
MPVFFTDRDLGKQFPAILRGAGLDVETHADHFQPSAPDEEWLTAIGERGWLAVTHDGRIRYKPNELAAVQRHRVALFVVIGSAPHAELARNFVRTAKRIAAFAERHDPPYIAKVHRPLPSDLARNPDTPGTVTLWFPR